MAVALFDTSSPLAPLGAQLRGAIDRVLGVSLLDFGIPEAMWKLHVHDFMAIVTMDAHGHSLHADLERETGENLQALETISAR